MLGNRVRLTHRHHRGESFLAKRFAVSAAVPAAPRGGTARNRLGFAQWLVDPVNPLTARVTVNGCGIHFW